MSPTFQKDWNIEIDFNRSGAYHMLRDEELARLLGMGLTPNTLRLYSWTPAAISLGHTQRIEDVNMEGCLRRGIDVVVRPTGGRAVLHKNELTYAVIMPEDVKGLYASHNSIAKSLLASFSILGPNASQLHLTGPERDRGISTNYRTSNYSNAACFTSVARHEITWRGKKLVGSAQRRMNGVVLQHGSILLNRDHLELPDLLNIAPGQKAIMRRHLEEETTNLSEVMGRSISIEEATNALRDNFVMHICTGNEDFAKVLEQQAAN